MNTYYTGDIWQCSYEHWISLESSENEQIRVLLIRGSMMNIAYRTIKVYPFMQHQSRVPLLTYLHLVAKSKSV